VSIVVDVQYAAERNDLPDQAQITHWVETALAGQRSEAELTVRIVDEAEGRALNERWRGGSGATNVLSFPAGNGQAVVPELLGDIVICAPVVSRESVAQGKTESEHWAHLVIHGVLHLLGFEHTDEKDAKAMESLEIEKLKQLGFGNPYVQEQS
jgi:probable rRNA maturation factor